MAARMIRLRGHVFGPYRAFLSWPAVLPVAACAYVGRLTSGMAGIALLLLVQNGTHSFTEAGIALAVYGAAVAVASPAVGRLIDRFGATRPLLICGAAYPLSLFALVLSVDQSLGVFSVVAASATAGATVPQLASAVRGLWSTWLPEGSIQQAAFAMESVVTDAAFIIGPLIVGIVTRVIGVEWALGITAASAAIGAVGLAQAARSQPSSRHVCGPARRARPLSASGLRVLASVSFVGATVYGVVPVVVSALARDNRKSAAAVGILLGLWSVGSLTGGLWYGTRRWNTPVHRQYLWALVALAVGLIPISLARSLAETAIFLIAGGLALAITETLELRLVASLAPDGSATEAFGWLNTASYLGFATGSALAGLMVDTLGAEAASLLPGVLAAASAAIAFAWRRQLSGLPPSNV